MFLSEWQQVIFCCRACPVSRVIFDGKHVIFTSNCQNLGLHLKNIPSERPPTVWENISFAYFSFSLACRLMFETNRQKRAKRRKENDDSFLNEPRFVAPLLHLFSHVSLIKNVLSLHRIVKRGLHTLKTCLRTTSCIFPSLFPGIPFSSPSPKLFVLCVGFEAPCCAFWSSLCLLFLTTPQLSCFVSCYFFCEDF